MVEYINQGNNDTRSGFGEGLTELGRSNNDVVALCADLTGSLKMNVFAKENPKRFLEKFGFLQRKRQHGKLIWFHCSSVGEFLSIVPLLEKLEKEKDEVQDEGVEQ